MNKQIHTDVLSRLPHRAPMLMIDSILSLSRNDSTALKSVAASEPCFQGHFPGNPVFPGVLIIEALAQTCALCLSEQESGRIPIFSGIQNADFLHPVHPGDQLFLHAHFLSRDKRFYTFQTTAAVNGDLVCSALLTIYL